MPILDSLLKFNFFLSGEVQKVKGRVFAMFGRKQFVTKLPKARVDELVASGVGKHFDPGHGCLMRGRSRARRA
jgi:hypothetical protein